MLSPLRVHFSIVSQWRPYWNSIFVALCSWYSPTEAFSESCYFSDRYSSIMNNVDFHWFKQPLLLSFFFCTMLYCLLSFLVLWNHCLAYVHELTVCLMLTNLNNTCDLLMYIESIGICVPMESLSWQSLCFSFFFSVALKRIIHRSFDWMWFFMENWLYILSCVMHSWFIFALVFSSNQQRCTFVECFIISFVALTWLAIFVVWATQNYEDKYFILHKLQSGCKADYEITFLNCMRRRTNLF